MSSNEAIWFVVLEGEQTGPISAQDVEAYFRNGQIDVESFIWRDGLDDWVGLTTLAEFSHLAPATNGHATNGHYGDPLADVFGEQGDHYEATRQVSAAEVFGSGYRPEGDEEPDFGSTRVVSMGSLTTEATADAPEAAPPSSGFSFTAPSESAGSPSSSSSSGSAGGAGGAGGGFSFSAAAAVGGGAAMSASLSSSPTPASSLDILGSLPSSEPSTGGMFDNAPRKSANDLVGARSENSVLFSLNNLRAVSAPTAGPGKDLPTTEGSGLIDIKALASANQGPSPVDNRKSFSEGDAFDHAVVPVPAMMPMSNRKSNTGLFVALGIGALLILGLIGAVVWLIFFKTDPPPVIQQVAEEDQGVKTPTSEQVTTAQLGQPPTTGMLPPPTGGQLPPPTGGQLPNPTANPTANPATNPPTNPDLSAQNPATNPDGTPATNPPTNPDGTPATNPDSSNPTTNPPPTAETEEERKEKERKRKEKEEKERLAKEAADKAAADAAKNPPPKDPPPKDPEPPKTTSGYTLQPADVTKVVNAEFGKINTCTTGADVTGTLVMSWKIKSDGRTSGVTTNSAEFKGSKVARCIERVVQGFRFPEHNKPEVPINNYKFNVK